MKQNKVRGTGNFHKLFDFNTTITTMTFYHDKH